jgi:hypothetical protein
MQIELASYLSGTAFATQLMDFEASDAPLRMIGFPEDDHLSSAMRA